MGEKKPSHSGSDMSGISFEDHPFWDYALSVYGGDGVSAACIALQDKHEIDVNYLLLSLWTGHDGRPPLTPAEFDELFQVTESWNREIVCEIRDLRAKVSSGYGAVGEARRSAVRNAVLTLEIDCEHVELLAMAEVLGPPLGKTVDPSEARAVVLSNIKSYFNRRQVSVDAEDFVALATILASAYPGTDTATVRELWND
jgi:uncharacterized protein (TIGR02444 family)